MTYLVVSDTHGRADRLREAIQRQSELDGIIFLGDGYADLRCAEDMGIPVHAVKGNCDYIPLFYPETVQEELLLHLGAYTVLVTHGHRYGVKGGTGALIASARGRGAHIVLFGHTHERCEQYDTNGTPVYAFNPGSLGAPRTGGASFGILHIRGGQVLLSHGNL
ncbi:MAG: YfcE family phosphodiesterase [Ruminococcaceae bacterium]|nr:YfcE family phosphodiesterase [Oscillospiraceae bacterium]